MIYHRNLAFLPLRCPPVDRVILPILPVACSAVVFEVQILDRPVVSSLHLVNEPLHFCTVEATWFLLVVCFGRSQSNA